MDKTIVNASPIEQWHHIVENADMSGLNKILADDVVFHSPVVHTPQKGKAITRMYLMGAFHVLLSGPFQYEREVIGTNDAVLEFTTEIDGVVINGVDMMSWNEQGQIIDFKVMLRPLKAINLVHQKMGEMLEAIKNGKMVVPA